MIRRSPTRARRVPARVRPFPRTGAVLGALAFAAALALPTPAADPAGGTDGREPCCFSSSQPPAPARTPLALADAGRALAASVRTADGAPCAGARVDVLWPGGLRADGVGAERGVLASATADADGAFELRSARFDEAWDGCCVVVRVRGRPPHWVTAASPGESAARDATPNEIVLPPACSVPIRLEYGDGTPLAGATLRLATEGGVCAVAPTYIDPVDARLDADGRAELAIDARARRLDVLVDHAEHRALLELPLDGLGDGSEARLVLERQATLDVTLGGPVAAWLEPHREAEVRFEPLGDLAPTRRDLLQVGLDGVRAAPLSRGGVHVRHVTVGGDGYRIVIVDSGRRRVLRESWVAEPGANRLELELPEPLSFVPGLRWRLPVELDVDLAAGLDAEGLARAEVVAVDDVGRRWRAGVDARGRRAVSAPMMPPVRVEARFGGVTAARDGLRPGDRAVLAFDAERVVRRSGAVEFDRLADVDEPSSDEICEGCLESAEDGPRLVVTLLAEGAARPIVVRNRDRIAALAPGRYRYAIAGDGVTPSTGTLEIVAGETVRLEL